MMNLHHCLLGVSSKRCWRAFVAVVSPQCRNISEHPSAGIIVIGDEILKAQVRDTNSFYACSLLYKHGVKVKKISFVRDDIEDIVREIREFSKSYEYVITSGGIGPTHDDLTYEAVAAAFDDTLHYHPTLVDIVKNYFGYESLSSPGYKMAHIPTKATLKFGTNEATGKRLPYPCVVLQNVYVFPGSPFFFEQNFQSACKEFSKSKGFATTEIYINATEETFANILSGVAKEYPNVTFGSYPERNRYYKARITIESENEEDTEKAKKKLCDLIPTSVLVHYDKSPHVDCLAKYDDFLQRTSQRAIYESSFEKFVKLYRKPEEVSMYLDGSVESIVMVHLARTVNNKLGNSRMKFHAFRFESDNLQPDAERFLREVVDRYNVELCVLRNEGDAHHAIKDLTVLRPELRTLLLAKRMDSPRKDIYENLTRPSTGGHLEHLEIHFPLIDWTHEDVAIFAASLSLPYFTIQENRSITKGRRKDATGSRDRNDP